MVDDTRIRFSRDVADICLHLDSGLFIPLFVLVSDQNKCVRVCTCVFAGNDYWHAALSAGKGTSGHLQNSVS